RQLPLSKPGEDSGHSVQLATSSIRLAALVAYSLRAVCKCATQPSAPANSSGNGSPIHVAEDFLFGAGLGSIIGCPSEPRPWPVATGKLRSGTTRAQLPTPGPA